METHATVADMAHAYAQKALAAAAAANQLLDFSERSLLALEQILEAMSRPEQTGDLDEACKTWGCYLGEVVRRRFGGEWSIETYPGKHFATLTLTVNGNKIYPSLKIHRRLTSGAADNVCEFYQMIKARLEAHPGGKVQ